MKKRLTFRGGVHPNDKKAETAGIPIARLSVPKTLVFPMQQHIGKACDPIVSVGDRVCMGQKIADSDAYVSSPIFSSVSGTVKEIRPYPLPNGSEVRAVIIENDYEDTPHESIKPIDWETVNPNDIPQIVREAGIVGMGGAAFPTHIKLMPPKEAKIDTVIVNGAECEPYLTSDHRVMLETPDEVVTGLKIILRRFGIENGHIAIEENKPDAIAVMEKKCNGNGISVDILKKKYPQGGEKQLIRAVTGRTVPQGKLPSDVGAVVVNVDTCTAIARKFLYGTPLMRRIVTVAGNAVKTKGNFSVRLGTPIEHIISECGGFLCEPSKIIVGGPMMGTAQFRLDVPVIKNVSAVLCFDENEARLPEENPCIRCGRCVAHCPMRLMPLYLYDFAKKGELDQCEKYNVSACIECGCCSFECPSKRHLVQNIRIAKERVAAERKNRER